MYKRERRALFLGFKFIANAPHCFERPFITDAFQLFPQPLNVDIDGARITVIIKAPHLVEQLITGENTVWIAGEVIDQFKLCGRRVNLLAVYAQLIVR